MLCQTKIFLKEPAYGLALYHPGYAYGQAGNHVEEVFYYEKAIAFGLRVEESRSPQGLVLISTARYSLTMASAMFDQLNLVTDPRIMLIASAFGTERSKAILSARR